MSEHVLIVDVLNYAVVERERRFDVAAIPEGVTQTLRIGDCFIEPTRRRLRRGLEVRSTPVQHGTEYVVERRPAWPGARDRSAAFRR
jgi:hypothetical protein